MPKTSSEDRLASATEDLVAILKKPHPATPFLNQGTKTNEAIKQLQEIFTPRQQNQNEPTRVPNRTATRVPNCTVTRVGLPTIDENEIGTVIMKRYNNTVRREEVTHNYKDVKLYFIVYENGENEKISFRQLDRYRCTDTDRDTSKQITRLSTRLQRANLATEQ